jgi:hypothetical protein
MISNCERAFRERNAETTSGRLTPIEFAMFILSSRSLVVVVLPLVVNANLRPCRAAGISSGTGGHP